MSPASLIARDELRLMRRSKVALIAIALLLILSLIAVATAYAQRHEASDLRERFQATANDEFKSQPDRHPHRVVHYGHFVFRPLGALAVFDPGIDPFTGQAMFIEGHRQNSANFADVRQSSLLIRFGQLTPAFILQTLGPLLLIFLGFAIFARERDTGTLRQLLVQGVTVRELLAGKILALGTIAGLIFLPALISFTLIAGQPDAAAGPIVMIIAGYMIWLAFWVLTVILISTLVHRSRDALLVLIALWTVMVILIPRIAPDIAGQLQPDTTRLETNIAIAKDLSEMGDSHDPDDPYFAAFKTKTLARYGVERIEDLPVNYRGLLAVEGEKLTARLFDRYAEKSFRIQSSQTAIMDKFSIVSPIMALRRLSMASAGTDLNGHRRFLEQAEAYRYAIVQRLNQLQADAVSFADDAAKSENPAADKRSRLAGQYWKDIPDFQFKPLSAGERARSAMPSLLVLLGWLALVGGSIMLTTRYLLRSRL